MARYKSRVKIEYTVGVEVTADNDGDAFIAVDDILTNQLPDLAGNYSGSTVEVLETETEIFGLFNKSSQADENQKRQNINTYIAQLDNEEKELLREILGD